MRKLLAFFFCLVIIVGTISTTVFAAEEKEELLNITLNTYSNQNGQNATPALYRDNTVYMDADTLSDLLGASVESQSDEAVEIHLHEGLRRIKVTADGTASETQADKTKTLEMPVAAYQDKLYISAPHFLRYAGAIVGFGEDDTALTHMMVYMPYTVLDLMYDMTEDYFTGDCRFHWSEVDDEFMQTLGSKTYHVMAGYDTILAAYNSNILAYGFVWGHADKVEKQIYYDVFNEILRNHGEEWVTKTSFSDNVEDLLILSSDWIFTVAEALCKDDVLVKYLKGTTDWLSLGAEALKAYDKKLETVLMFSSMTDVQKTLLDNTINRVSEKSSYYKQIPLAFKAAEEASAMMKDTYNTKMARGLEALNTLLTSGATKLLTGNPFNLAAETIGKIVTSTPLVKSLVENEKRVIFSTTCNDINLIANDLFVEDLKEFEQNNAYLGVKSTALQEYIKADAALALKTALVTRELLLNTDCVSGKNKSAMENKARKTAELLAKAETAVAQPIGLDPVVDEDLTWAANLAGVGRMGDVVSYKGKTYYWKYTDNSFNEENYGGYSYKNTTNTLVSRNNDGTEKEVAKLDGHGVFVLANDRIFYESSNSEICSVGLDGKNKKTWGTGTLRAVTENGEYIIIDGSSDDLISIAVMTGEKKVLAADSRFVKYYAGVVYYNPILKDTKAAKAGKVTLYRVAPNGRRNKCIYVTDPDLYDNGQTPAYTARIRFDGEYIYFSYGSVDGSGSFYQGGKIARVKYDGKDGEVIAGNDKLVSAEFYVDNGYAYSGDAGNYDKVNFSYHEKEYVQDGIVYINDPASGDLQDIIIDGDYDAVGTGPVDTDIDGNRVEIGFAEVIDGKVYYLMHSGELTTVEGMGWRGQQVYKRQKSAMMMKDMETSEVTVLYEF